MLTIDDFVMLGKTVPEARRRDGRVFVCSAGFSPTLRSLVRIYPLARRNTPERWSVSTVKLIRNSEDSRLESFKLAGDRTPGAHERINNSFLQTDMVPPRARADLLKPYVVGSIAEANERRMSLAILHPSQAPELTFEYNPESPDSPELTLFDIAPRPTEGAKRFAYIPRLRWQDGETLRHIKLLDWGCYEFMRKQGDDRRFGLPGALHLDATCSLLVGNHSHQRTTWLVISVLRGLRGAPSLLDELAGDAA